MSLRKTLISVLTLVILLSSLTACGIQIPIDYIPVPPNEAYDVSVTSVEKPVLTESKFKLIVTTTNITNKVLYEKTNSTMYENGVRISIWLIKDDKKYILVNNFQPMTDDERVQVIEIGEVIIQDWEFFAKTHDYRKAPVGKYTLEIMGIRLIPDFLEITDKKPPKPDGEDGSEKPSARNRKLLKI